jgi:hypothetical protein
MKTYSVPINREDDGYVTIQAKSKKDAYKKVMHGEWKDSDYEVKNGWWDAYLDDITIIN